MLLKIRAVSYPKLNLKNQIKDLAYDLTKNILADNPDLDGIICCNMSNPV